MDRRGCRTGWKRSCRACGAARIVGLVYDHDPDDVALLGWEEFIARQWEAIFTGYRSWTGLRRMGRRWADLLEAGLSCSHDLADRLVQDEIINSPDRNFEAVFDADAVLAGMFDILGAIRDDLEELDRSGELGPDQVARLLEQHAQLAAAVGAPDEPR